MSRNSNPGSGRVAVITNSLHHYHSKILSGVKDVLAEQGLSCTTLVGQTLRHPDVQGVHANDIYTLIDEHNFAGLIVLTGALGTNVADLELSRWIERFAGLPVVSIGREVASASNLLLDNRPAVDRLMAHLLDDIGVSHPVFVQGIEGNHDSDEREAAYREALHQRGLPIDEELFVRGDFASVRTYRVVTELLRVRQGIDAFVCANDEMAEGAIQAITAAGWRVPHDIAVVGFDDADEFRHVVPALTTARQPIYEQGVEAAQMLVDMLQHRCGRTTRYIHPVPVIRESCGARLKGKVPVDTTASPGATAEVSPEQASLLSLFEDMAPWPDSHASFLGTWNGRLVRRELLEEEFVSWRDGLLLLAKQNPIPAVQELAFAALSSLSSMVQMTSSRRHSLQVDLAEVTPRLFTCQDHESLLSQLKKYLRHVGLDRYALVLYEQFAREIPDYAKVVIDGMGGPVREAVRFATREIVPASLAGAAAPDLLVLSPLFVNATHFGFMLYEPPSGWRRFHDTSFCLTISHAIAQVENAIAARNHSFQLECQVQARTAALEAQVAETMRAEQALRAANVSLQHVAFHDGLTQLYNRSAFNEHFGSQWSQHLRQQRALSLLICDVDHFKKYNDLHGHVLGDDCLRQVARALQRAVRTQRDIVARYGGEEFVVVLPFTDHRVAAKVAERIQEEVARLQMPHGAEGAGNVVTLSIGVATKVPQAGGDRQSLLEAADTYLYQAKARGRACFVAAPW